MVTSGSLTASTTIESIMDTDYGCSNVAGLVGEPFEITTTCTFETATLSYKVDQTKLGETEFDDLLFYGMMRIINRWLSWRQSMTLRLGSLVRRQHILVNICW